MQPIKMMSRKTQSGFSLIELLIVVAIAMILMAMTAPLVVGTLNTYYLRQAGTEYANMLQTARMRAVQDDQYYDVTEKYGSQAAGVSNAFDNKDIPLTSTYLAGVLAILNTTYIAIGDR